MSHQAPDAATADLALEIDTLVRRGPLARHELVRLADRGDWRTRVLALSALGRLVCDDRSAHARFSLQATLARVPLLRRRAVSTGRYGRLISGTLANAAGDRLFIVRMAAALALGECRDPALDPILSGLQRDPFRPVRIAAGAGRMALGHAAAAWPDAPGLATTPDLIADGVATSDWLRLLSSAHDALVSPMLGRTGDGAMDQDVVGWLSGAGHQTPHGGVAPEAARYQDADDLRYQGAKPFGGADRRENLRQLDALVTLLSHLDAPRGATVIDLGGGSGWVGEFLARFGFRALVVDVSLPLLQLAHQRFAVAGLPGAALGGDMTALPLRAQSVEAVIILDALHHVAALPAVLAEVRRVLVPGGQLLIGEPGEGHSESSKSLAERFRARCTRGRGASPDTVLGRSTCGRIHRWRHRAAPAGVARAADRRLAGGDALTGRSMDLPGTDGDTTVRFETAVVRAMLARPMIVLRNGRRARDTRAPGCCARASTRADPCRRRRLGHDRGAEPRRHDVAARVH